LARVEVLFVGIEKLCFGDYEVNLLYGLFLGADNGLTKIDKPVCQVISFGTSADGGASKWTFGLSYRPDITCIGFLWVRYLPISMFLLPDINISCQ